MSGPPRVSFVTRKWPPAMGGMETYSYKITDHLRAHAEMEVIALPGHADGSTPRPWELVRFGIRTAAALLFARHPAAVTHVADMASWPFGLAARLRRPSGRRILSAHGTDVCYPARGGALGRAYAAYLRLGARLLGPTKVIANSRATAAAAETFGFHDTAVVPLAAEVDAPAGAGARRPDPVVLFTGRLIARKGCRWFAERVLPHLPEPIEMEVAGTVWDEAERAALDAPRVRWLGRLDQPDLHRRMREVLCVVVPNVDMGSGEFEGFGLVAVEAAMAGGVVVAGRHGGLEEAVRHVETGFLVAPGDVEDWVETIGRIAAWSPEERAAFVDGAQDAAARYYNWERVARDTARHYRADDRPAA